MSEDFSLKWFGIPDAQVVAFWKLLKSMHPGIPHNPHQYCYCGNCRQRRAAEKQIAEFEARHGEGSWSPSSRTEGTGHRRIVGATMQANPKSEI